MFRRVNNNKFGVIEYAIDTEEDLLEAIRVYQKRNRRFGGRPQ